MGFNVKFNLGVTVVPEPESNLNSFELANIIENKYELFSKYGEMRLQFIADSLTESLGNALDDILMGSPVKNPYADAEQEIEQNFKDFISKEEHGIPRTMAGKMGYSRRFKGRKGPPRPSFIDTGTLQNSIKTWVEDGNS